MTTPKKVKPPSVESAATVAATLARLLKRDGFALCDTSDRHRWTEGVRVSRIGYSTLVSVDYHRTERLSGTAAYADEALRARAAMAKVRAWLIDRGYPLAPEGEYRGLAVKCLRS